jgi:hypothetical protein
MMKKEKKEKKTEMVLRRPSMHILLLTVAGILMEK